MDWILDLLTTYIHHSELQVITAPLLIYTIHRSPLHPLSHFPACCVFSSRSLATVSNSGDSSAFLAHVVTVHPETELLSTVNWTVAPSILSLPCRAQLNCKPSTEATHQPLHFTQPNCTQPYSLGADPTENTACNGSSVVMGGCLELARMSFPRERVYRAVTKQCMFLLAIVA
jgi:hypothetical protein